MELSLMYDILYTKAAVMHTWFGFAIRVVSPLAVAAALGLFRLEDDLGSYRQIDVDITYALLVAAFVLETTSLCRAIGSTWIAALLQTTRWAWLRHEALCTGRRSGSARRRRRPGSGAGGTGTSTPAASSSPTRSRSSCSDTSRTC
jgi:hypothetical protein